VAQADTAAWRILWDAYLAFYKVELPETVTQRTFARLVAGEALHGAIARSEDGEALGLVHWVFHPSTWSTADYCYLEDLYVSPAARGNGVGRALIEHVTSAATIAGASKLYWLTHESNTTARSLYERTANRTGFIHYERPLP